MKLYVPLLLIGLLVTIGCTSRTTSETSDDLARFVFDSVRSGSVERLLSAVPDEATAREVSEMTGRSVSPDGIRERWESVFERRRQSIEQLRTAVDKYRSAETDNLPETRYIRFLSSERADQGANEAAQVVVRC